MDLQRVFAKVYMWMFIGLLITFVTGYAVSINDNMAYNVSSTGLLPILFIAEIGVVIFLSVRINKMGFMGCVISFLLYSILTGITFALVFLTYKLDSIIFVFGITAFIFAIFSLFGYFTKIDLSKIGTILFMGLIGIIIAFGISYFVDSVALNLGFVIFGLIIFIGYTAYDIQKIKYRMTTIDDQNKLAIYGALQLYIDFIGIFIRLLRLFGGEKK